MKSKELAILILFSILAVSVVGLSHIPQASAIGGGQTVPPSAYVPVASGVTGSTAPISNIIQNDYIIVVVGFEGTAHTVSTVTDSASPATSFSKEASSSANEDIEIWCGQYTASSGSDAITVKTSTSASYSFRAIFAAGLTSCAPNTIQRNNGNSGSPSVASFTPVTGDFCEAATSDATGSASSTWSIVSPFNSQGYYSNLGATVVLQSQLTSGTGWVADSFKGDWDSSYGSTTAAFTSSANSSPLWDEAVACFPTSSSGDEMFQGRGFFPRGSSVNPNLGVQAPLHDDYIVAIITLPVPSLTSQVTSVTDGQSDTYTKVVSSGINDDVEMWVAYYTGTSGASIGQLTFNLNVAEPAVIGNFEISGISSTTAQTATASGTSGAASVSSFTPDTNDVCIEASSFNAGTNPVVWTTPANQPFQQVDSTQQGQGFNNNYFVTAFRADWPTSTPTTATLTPSATSGNPAWDEIVVCFPGTVIVPFVCNMVTSGSVATLALSESSGNSLTPSSVPCDGNQHLVTVDPSVTLTATEPTDATYTRYRFAGGTNTATDAVCVGSASGECSSWTLNNYEQLQNTYSANPFGPTTFSPSITFTVTGSLYGGPVTVCTISVPASPSSGAYSCSGYADYDTAVTMPANSGNNPPNAYWFVSGTSTYTDTTGDNTHTSNYYEAFAPSSLSGSLSLSPSLDQGLGITKSGTIALSSAIATQAALSSVVSAAILLSTTVNQGISGIAEATNTALSASLGVQGALSTLLSASIALASSINQGLAATVSPGIGLTSTLSAQAALSATASAAVSLTATVDQGISAVTAAASVALAAGLSIQATLSELLSGAVSLATSVSLALGVSPGTGVALLSSISQDLSGLAVSVFVGLSSTLEQGIGGMVASASVSLSPVLQVGATLSAILSYSESLLPGLNLDMSNGLSQTLSLAASVNQDLGIAVSSAMSLGGSLNQDLAAIVAGASLSLSPLLQIGASLFATLSASLSLSTILNQDLGSITASATLSLLSAVNQVLSNALSPSLSLAATLGQDLGSSLSASLSLTSSVAQAVSSSLSSAVSLAATLDQDLSVTIQPLGLTLSSGLSALLSGFLAVLNASISLTSGLNQSIGVFPSNTMTLVGSVYPTLVQAGRSFFAALTATVSLSSTVNQALGSITLSAALSLMSALEQSVGGIFTAMMTTSASLSTVLQVGRSFFAALTATMSLSSTVNQALGSITLSAALSLMSTMGQSVGGILSGITTLTGSLSTLKSIKALGEPASPIVFGGIFLLGILVLGLVIFALFRRRRKRRDSRPASGEAR